MFKNLNNIIKNIFFIIFLLYEEILFETILKINFFNTALVKFLFIIIISLILNITTRLLRKQGNSAILKSLVIIISATYAIHFCYYIMYGNILSIYTMIHSTIAIEFSEIALKIALTNWYKIILFLLPILFCFKNFEIERINKKEFAINTVLIIIFYVVTIGIINIKTDELYSAPNLYYNLNNPLENVKSFGLITTIRLDFQRSAFGFQEKELYVYKNNNEQEILKVEEYNMLDIDFEYLIENEENDVIKEIHEYISKQKPTEKNEYTGMFKDKNLIVVIAESFSELAIRDDLTPTLYKLYNNGFKFENYYTPLFPVGTADGEYILDNSLIPAEGVWSMETVYGNYMPYSYANLLSKRGYRTYAYHNYKYDYYNRDKYLETLGFSSYLAVENGLEERMDCIKYPNSDYEMVKVTIDDYIYEDKFLAYYVTMSGHCYYDSSNDMVVKNWELVKDLPYSNKAKGYLSANIELDRAMEELINRLERENKLDDTVIVIVGDHYPFGLNIDEINELSTYKRDDEFEKVKMPFIIYNSDIDETIEVDKYASNLDVLPTILNLLGIEYDSRLLMGKDILSSAEPLVIFSSRSFITNKGKYNSYNEIFTAYNGTVTEGYIEEIKKEIYYKYRYSRLILENNYYNILKNN